MMLVIRIAGMVEIRKDMNESLHRMRLRRKYSATLLKDTKENQALLLHVRNFVAYGPIDKETLLALLQKRGQLIDKKKKVDASTVLAGLDKKSLSDLGIKPFFRLHPPRGGIDSKLHFPRGVLGDNKEKINDLVRRML